MRKRRNKNGRFGLDKLFFLGAVFFFRDGSRKCVLMNNFLCLTACVLGCMSIMHWKRRDERHRGTEWRKDGMIGGKGDRWDRMRLARE